MFKLLQKSKRLAQQVDFVQIYWKDEQLKELFPFADAYLNEGLTPFFENTVISEVVNASKADKIAVCSWSLRQKMTMRIPPRRELTAEVLQEDFDVMSFTKNSPDHDMLGALEVWHPGSKEILHRLFEKLGYRLLPKPKFPIYQNAFCARAEVYKAYVQEFLNPAMDLMATDDELRGLLFRNSGYNRTTLNQPVDMARIRKYLGLPWYPLHPFILERCFSIWIDNRNLKITYL